MSRQREVVIDARWLRSGIGRYILTLLQDLKSHLPDTLLTCITMSPHAPIIAPLCDRVLEMNCGIYSLAEQMRLPFAASGATVFCAPHYNIPLFRRDPTIVTIHDLTHLLFPTYRDTRRIRAYASRMLRIASTRASRIIVPSNYTRQAIINRFSTNPGKISVIPCAVSESFWPRPKVEAAQVVERCHRISVPYILYVGSTAPHKNLATLMRAYRVLSSRHKGIPDLVLVLPDKPSRHGGAEGLTSLMTMSRVHCLHSVSDDALASLYSAAELTVAPSIEEGFGLPVIESMACGTAVASARAASLPEIAGGNAIFFDPFSVEEMASALERGIFSEELRQQLAVEGLKRAAEYSVGRAAKAYASEITALFAQKECQLSARQASMS